MGGEGKIGAFGTRTRFRRLDGSVQKVPKLSSEPETVAAEPPNLTTVQLRAIRRLLTGIFIIVSFAAAYFARDLLLPLVLAVLIVLTLSPVVRAMQKIGIPPAVTAVAMILVIMVAALLSFYMMRGPVSTMLTEAPSMAREIRWKLRDIFDQIAAVKEVTSQVGNLGSDAQAPAQQVVVTDNTAIEGFVSSAATAGSSLIAALILSVFVLSSGDFFIRRIVEVAPRLTDKKKALTIIRDIEKQISRYLGAITLINAALGAAIGLGMWMIGMPYAYLWAIGAFLLNFVPFLGAVTGIILSAAIALVTFDSVGLALLAPLIYFGCTAIEGQFITPTLVGRRLELNTSAVFLTVVFWVWLWGVPGALLAVPILVLVKVICDNIEGMRSFGLFLGNEPTRET